MSMCSITPMKTAKIGYIVVSALLCVLGVLLMILPSFMTELLGFLCGIFMIVFGAVKLIGYFSKDLYRLAFQYDFAFGLLYIVLGAIMLSNPSGIVNFVVFAFGFSALTDGLFKIQIALESKRFGISKWWIIFGLAIVSASFGGVLLVRPSESAYAVTVLLGFSLVCQGLLNFGTVLTAVKIIRHQQPDTIKIDHVLDRKD